MQYKGYTARVEFDQDAGVLFGEVEGLRDVVTFETDDVKDMTRAFHESVDDYLAMCAERGEEPEKPYSGKFLLRVEPELHRDVAKAAARAGTSLNAYVGEILKRWVRRPPEQRSAEIVPEPNASRLDAHVEKYGPEPALVEIAATPELGLELCYPRRQDTPAWRTPNTPGSSQTPQQVAQLVQN